MGARGGLVRVRGFGSPSAIALVEEVHDLLRGNSLVFGNSSDGDTLDWVVAELEVLGLLDEEVANGFVVDFNVADENLVLVVEVAFDEFEHVSDC